MAAQDRVGPAYTGVAVLALCLLGCLPEPNMGTCAQSEVVFRRETGHVDPNEWSVGCFKTRDQLLPFFCSFSMETLLCCPEGQRLASGKGRVIWNPGKRFGLGYCIGRSRLPVRRRKSTRKQRGVTYAGSGKKCRIKWEGIPRWRLQRVHSPQAPGLKWIWRERKLQKQSV